MNDELRVDVVALLSAIVTTGYFPALRLDELWVSFGVDSHFRQIAYPRDC